METVRERLTQSLVVLALLWPLPLQAQAGVTLEVVPAKHTFFQGEPVRLTLRFHTEEPGVFAVNNASGDRSGRLSIDRFHLDHWEWTTDPLAGYYRVIGGYIGGGLSAEIELDSVVDIPVVLNEWVRFDRAGPYRIHVESQRVVYRGHRATPPLTVTSGEAEFEIVPADPRWAMRTLSEASAAIDRIAAQFSGRVVSYQELTATRDELDGALRALRFLGTAGAAREMMRHLALDHAAFMWQPRPGGASPAGVTPPPVRHDRSFELIAGLFGSPHRALVVSEMEARLASGEPASSGFIRALDLLHRAR